MSGAGFLVVAAMSVALLVSVVTVCLLAWNGQESPEVLDRLVQGLLVGVPALLANTRKTPDQPQAVTVEQPPGQPVPVIEGPGDVDVLDPPPASRAARVQRAREGA